MNSLAACASLLFASPCLGASTLQADARFLGRMEVFDVGTAAPVEFAFGDMNGDGLPDLVGFGTATPSASDGVLLYANDGAGQLALSAVVALADTDDLIDLTLTDWDDDSDLDVLLVQGDLLLRFRGDGAGALSAEADLALDSTACSVNAADLDADGDTDLLVTLESGAFEVLLQGPAGQYSSAVTAAAFEDSPQLELADANGDGRLDLIGISTEVDELQVRLGLGDGTFRAPLRSAFPGFAQAEYLAEDFDGDGTLDVFALQTSQASGPVEAVFWRGQGDGRFVSDAPFTVTVGATLFAADRHGEGIADGDLDVLSFDASGLGLLRVLENDGAGAFTPDSGEPLSVYEGTNVLVDFDGDGRDDLFTASDWVPTSGGEGRALYLVTPGLPDGSLPLPDAFPLDLEGERLLTLVPVDRNRDGVQDLLGVTEEGTAVTFSGDGARGFTRGFESLGDLELQGVAVGDIDGDCLPDLVSIEKGGEIEAFLGQEDGSWLASHSDSVGLSFNGHWITLVDLDGDGALDIVSSSGLSSGEIAAFLGDGTGAFGAAATAPLSEVIQAGVGADLDGDGNADLLLVPTTGSVPLSILPGDGTGGALAQVDVATPSDLRSSIAPTIVDLDGDGLRDIVWSALRLDGPLDPMLIVCTNLGGFSFEVEELVLPQQDGPLSLGDANGDGVLDALLGDLRPALILGSAEGSFTPEPFDLARTSDLDTLAQVLFDLDLDGRADHVEAVVEGFHVRWNLGPVLDGVCQPDVGFGGPGDARLQACGDALSTGSSVDLEVHGAAPNRLVFFLGAPTLQPTCLFGLDVAPFPVEIVQTAMADGAGNAVLGPIAGGGGPLPYYVQAAYADPSLPLGFGATNAVRLDLLP